MSSTLVLSIGEDILLISRRHFHRAERNQVSNSSSAVRDRMKENAQFLLVDSFSAERGEYLYVSLRKNQ
jgi:hypothetical protein